MQRMLVAGLQKCPLTNFFSLPMCPCHSSNLEVEFIFPLFKKAFIFVSLLKVSFTRYEISFSTLKMSLHCHLSCMVASEKSAINLIIVLLLISFLSMLSRVSLCFQFLTVWIRCAWVCFSDSGIVLEIHSAWCLLSFLDLWFDVCQ